MNRRKTELDPTCPAEEVLIVERVLRGEVDAFALLIERYQVKVSATARRYLPREEDAEDAIQTVFIKAFQKLRDWRREAPFEHWLSRIAPRVCLDKLKKSGGGPRSFFRSSRPKKRFGWITFAFHPQRPVPRAVPRGNWSGAQWRVSRRRCGSWWISLRFREKRHGKSRRLPAGLLPGSRCVPSGHGCSSKRC